MPASDIPNLFDQTTLLRNLTRAAANGNLPGFLDDVATTELIDRFETISRKFSNVAIISHDASRIADAVRSRLSGDGAITDISILAGDRVFLDNPNLPAEAFDCIFACPGLEWANDLPGSLSRLRQALRPDGVLLAAMLGGESLHELRASWLQAETMMTGGASPRVAPFCDVRDAGGLLQRAGFALPVVDTDRLKVRYDNGLALMKDLKALGLSNSMAERRRSLVTPGLMAMACAHYDQNFSDPDNRVRATFQMIYLTGWSPHESQPRPLRPGSAKTRLADALRVDEKKLPRE
ncbi:MAG: SAM-dependent methyltransferase [Anderseniella sp.]|nr:SAM-dependent methyltransferase [Anderseniella sp.]